MSKPLLPPALPELSDEIPEAITGSIADPLASAVSARRTRKGMTARDLELAAAKAPPFGDAGRPWPPGEAVAMLARRGFKPTPAPLDLPLSPDLDDERVARLVERLRHYGFRLFLRGAIQRPDGFRPAQATRYLTPAQSKAHAESLVDLGLGECLPRGRYRLEELARRRPHARIEPRRVERELWALTPHLYAVNAKPDLVANIGRALAEGLLALSP